VKLFLSPLYDNDNLWHEIKNSYRIVSRNGPRALLASQYTMTKTCLGLPRGTTVSVTDALSGETCLVGWLEAESQDGGRGWIEAASHDDICPFSLAYLGRAPARVVLPRSSPEVDNPRYPPHVQVVVDQVDLDPHGRDTISAGLDFDEKGNELDDDEFSYDDEDPD
jgi:hypothetical protein